MYALPKPCYMRETPKADAHHLGNSGTDATMGNPQETVSAVELAWLAGFCDGEAYIGIQAMHDTRRNRNQLTFQPQIHITQVEKEKVDKAVEIWRKLGVNPYIRISKLTSKRRPAYRIQTKNMCKVERLLKPLIPYLTGSTKRRAELTLKYISLRVDNNGALVDNKGHNGRVWKWRKAKPYTAEELGYVIQVMLLTKQHGDTGSSQTIRKAARLMSDLTGQSAEDIVGLYAKA